MQPEQQVVKAQSQTEQSDSDGSDTDSSLRLVSKERIDTSRHEQALKHPEKTSVASQNSTAMGTFDTSAIPAEWHAETHQKGSNASQLWDSVQTAVSSHSSQEHEAAESLISSDSGVPTFSQPQMSALFVAWGCRSLLQAQQVSCICVSEFSRDISSCSAEDSMSISPQHSKLPRKALACTFAVQLRRGLNLAASEKCRKVLVCCRRGSNC